MKCESGAKLRTMGEKREVCIALRLKWLFAGLSKALQK